MGEISVAVYALTAVITLLAIIWAVIRRKFHIMDKGGDHKLIRKLKKLQTKTVLLPETISNRQDQHQDALQKPLEAVTKLVDTDAALDPASGIDVSGLDPLTRLTVRTHNTLYQLIVLSPEESKVLIQGGRFAEPVEASLGYGGGMLKTHIGLGMPMAIYRENGPVMTSPVRSVQAEGRLQLPGPF